MGSLTPPQLQVWEGLGGEPVARVFLGTRGAVDEQGELVALGLGFLQGFKLSPAPVSELTVKGTL